MDSQRGPTLGPLSTAGQSERSESKARSVTLLSGAELIVHASYHRAFQTPEFENILLTSSPDVVSLSDQVLRLPVKPAHGNC
jgi:hypothetical protein